MTAAPRTDAQLLARFPDLSDSLPWLALGRLPTPVEELPLAAASGARLWVKRDDLSAPEYGGNKVRKLELLLADALRRDAGHVLTFGTAGSNHVLATAMHGRRVGLSTIGILTHQSNAATVGRNLLGCLSARADLHVYASAAAARDGAKTVARETRQATGRPVVVIPGGGSSALGAVGFVEAAFELAAQVAAGLLPAPDRLYVALGTMGTAAGLALGLAAAGLATEVVPVRVVHPSIGNRAGFETLWRDTTGLLRRLCPAFPNLAPPPDRIRHDQFGEKYGVYTRAGQDAVRRAAGLGLGLEGTYTGKTFAALLGDLDAGRLDGLNVLFWDTYSSADLGSRIDGLDWRPLPADLHRYFTDPVQPLDR